LGENMRYIDQAASFTKQAEAKKFVKVSEN
jgi:hypothetical protein